VLGWLVEAAVAEQDQVGATVAGDVCQRCCVSIKLPALVPLLAQG